MVSTLLLVVHLMMLVVTLWCCSGLWSVLSVGILVAGSEALCNLHVTFEGLCYCELRLPLLVRREAWKLHLEF